MEEGGIPMGIWSGSDATNRLRETILERAVTTERQTRHHQVFMALPDFARKPMDAREKMPGSGRL